MRATATNRIQRLLDDHLVPWRVRREAAGAGRLLSGLAWRGSLDFPVEGMPATSIEMETHGGRTILRDPAARSLDRTQRVIGEHLGPCERLDTDRTLVRRWADQAGSLTLFAWKAGTRPDADGDARRLGSCHVDIRPGWRAALDQAERDAISDMVVFGRGTRRGVRTQVVAQPSRIDAAYLREPAAEAADLDGAIGLDASRGIVIACPGRMLALPLAHVVSFSLESCGDGSVIAAALTNGSSLVVAEHDEGHGLDLVSRALAKVLGDRVVLPAAAP